MKIRLIIYPIILLMSIISFIIRSYVVLPEVPFYYHKISFFLSLIMMTANWETAFWVSNRLDRFWPYSNGVASRMVLQVIFSEAIMMIFATIFLYYIRDYFPTEFNKIIT